MSQFFPIAGLVKFDIIDYPDKLACVLFTQGCNFRCNFCHNPDLLKIKKNNQFKNVEYEKQHKNFFDFLETRINKLDAVVITGGEPTIHATLPAFIQKIKNLGFLVKLDSQGTNPDMLEYLLNNNLIDYIAMDIKQTPAKYKNIVGRSLEMSDIQRSINLIQRKAPDYEFRTTVVPSIHTENDLLEIAQWIKGSKKYYLQRFRSEKVLDQRLKRENTTQILDFDRILKKIENNFGTVKARV